MTKNYFILDKDNYIKSHNVCFEDEIILENSDSYIETEINEFIFKNGFTYKFENGEVVEIENSDKNYLISKLNEEYSYRLHRLLSNTTQEEKETWIKQEQEARNYLLDNNAYTPLIDAMLISRTDHTKESLVNKILEKAENYSIEVGKLLGEKQAKEKEITLQ